MEINLHSRLKKILIFSAVILAAAVFLLSAYKIFATLIDYRRAEDSYGSLISQVVKREEQSASETPITVDFDELLKQNSDAVGWIYCENTPINYPILQSSDNNYYLRRMINRKYSSSGSVFMDYRSAADFSSLNSIVYGHNMKNDTMFGTFPKYENQEYYDAHPVIWLLTPQRNFKIELLAGYVTSSTSEAYNEIFSKNELKKHIDNAVEKSSFKSTADLTGVEKIITLSTCSYEYSNARYVLIGSLISID